MFAGRAPLSWLTSNPNALIDDKLQREEGTIPFSLLTPTAKKDKLFKRPMLSGILPSKLLQDAERNFKKRKISQERWDSSCQIVCSNPKIKKLWQRAKLLGECPKKFVPHYGHNPKFGAIDQACWNFSSQRIILNVEMLQSEQMTSFGILP